MPEREFIIGVKAEELYFDVFDKTTSRDHYPVRYRRLSDRMQACALDIYCKAIDANAVKADTDAHKQMRFRLKTEVIAECNKFLSMVKYSLHRNLISATTSEKWTGLAHDIKFMSISWRKTG